MTRRTIGRLAVAGWLLLGALAIAITPTETGPSRVESVLIYQDKPTSLSAAPYGTMAFRRVLARLGFEVFDHLRTGPPEAEVLVMLGHVHALGTLERESLLAWVEAGGRLIYAEGLLARPGSETEDAAGGLLQPSLENALIERAAKPPLAIVGDVSVLTIGRGRVAVLADGAGRLSNAHLTKLGLTGELEWLRHVLDGTSRVAFDEVRNGAAADEDIFAVAGRSGLGPGLWVLVGAIVVWLIALGTRLVPAVERAPALEQSYRQHLRSVGELFRRTHREKLSKDLLVSGARGRLGPLVARKDVGTALEQASGRPEVLGVATELARLEADLRNRRFRN
jgi:hypothetical protein